MALCMRSRSLGAGCSRWQQPMPQHPRRPAFGLRAGRRTTQQRVNASIKPLEAAKEQMQRVKALLGPAHWTENFSKLFNPGPAASGYLALFSVAVLWGSYTPALRYLFLSDEPPSAAMMNALQACLPIPFLAASGVASILARKKPRPVTMSSLNSLTSLSSIDDIYDPALSMTLPTPSELLSSSSNSNSGDQQGSILPPDAMLLASPRPLKNDFERACAYALNWCSPSLLIAGAELGLWLFADFALEVLGVQLISATKAAFLNQATVLITPFLVYLSGENVARMDWVACSVALVGSVLVAADGFASIAPPDAATSAAAAATAATTVSGAATAATGAAAAAATAQDGLVEVATKAADVMPPAENSLGYAYMLLSAVFFAMSTVRMGRYSTRFSSLDLASASTLSLAVLSLGWVLASTHGSAQGLAENYAMLQNLCSDPTRLAVLLWVGFGPGALAAFLQAAGQQHVAPAQAQVIYATTPIFATGLAFLFLHSSDEAMGPLAWFGAALMLSASVIASIGVTQHEAA